MPGTYTYTARSAENPAHMATFTLQDGRMSVDMGAGMESIERVVHEAKEQQGALAKAKAVASELPRLQPAIARMAQSSYDIHDVSVNASGDGLSVTAWTNIGGLKAVPMMLNWSRVDNPRAAQAFAEEIKQHKRETPDSGLPGPLDYWGTWIMGVLFGVALGWWLLSRRNSGQQSFTHALEDWRPR